MSDGAQASLPEADRVLQAHAARPLVRLVVCGSVDDGKSTLIGRLLHESRALLDDQLAALEADSRTHGTRGGDLDFALVTDGLRAEREQGITIDVAYRHFSTARHAFILADAPGHEQYTRNMVTGASTADAAVVLLDARKGVLTQTRRHTYLLSLLGVRRLILAVNKMDLVSYAREVFERAARDYREFCARLDVTEVTCIPLSAVRGDNVVAPSAAMRWYSGPTLVAALDDVRANAEDVGPEPFRLPVQRVVRPHPDFRGVAGLIAGGTVRPGDPVAVVPSGRQTRISAIYVGDRLVGGAAAGQSVTVTLADEVDVARGDVLADPGAPPAAADQFQATIVWLHESPLLPGRSYLLKLGAQSVAATVAPLKYKVNVNTLEHVAARQLDLNEIGVCDLELSRAVVFEPYRVSRALGGFILIDRLTHETVGAGLLHFALRRSQNVRWQPFDVGKQARAALKGQKPCVIWFTGLSGAGKSTIANLVEARLHALGCHTYLLDGDNVRHGLNKDLGFTKADRVENIRRVAELSRLLVDAGLVVLVAFISPFRAERRMARELVEAGEFFEVFVDAPLPVAEARDPKGLYRKARAGELKNFTGIDSPYEPPEQPELHLDTTTLTPAEAAKMVLERLQAASVIAVD
ncbi:MAG: adenylyl-sulfate kinase [Acidobacteria bacterium RIFCSPLOWO2_12_FULL_67_14]|nr:MAG: adenylyl-sulfate kinase [Acidobacteria bacterium RIFCSPLOWO2_02_FULL_67_21]OFW35204.1 MAG: adenylyl-sulfate kinase [Acidobacteria bacterium RIFCSPLOWO2_12_FULL_67_14]